MCWRRWERQIWPQGLLARLLRWPASWAVLCSSKSWSDGFLFLNRRAIERTCGPLVPGSSTLKGGGPPNTAAVDRDLGGHGAGRGPAARGQKRPPLMIWWCEDQTSDGGRRPQRRR